MICPSCSSFQSGDICKCCSFIFKPKKQPKLLQRSKTPVKKVSKKMSSDLREYGKLRKQFLLENPMCKKYPNLIATDIHHSRGRGRFLLDTSTWVPLSRKAHIEVEGNPELAKEQGFSLERLKTTT
jgi:hypothetical protein